ncbi:MAG: TatD family hydrolase [Phycisphaeraceae bacterium]|nr:TatD family hydrolase [Phycisphaeraceae bacterium]
MIDTHCHLTFPDFAGREAEVMAEAGAAGVTHAITISTTTFDCLDALAVARRLGNVYCTAGVHPLYADAGDERSLRRSGPESGRHVWDNLLRVARDSRCVAWGELGLDRHYETPAQSVQVAVLEEQLAHIERWNAASVAEGGIGRTGADGRAGLPVVIHCREAFAELIPILKRTRLEPDRFVFHCFTAGVDEMRMLLDFGAWVSFTGVVTYPKAAEVREAAKLAPVDRVMVETDAPFLPPKKHRGKQPCVPAWVVETARTLAEVKGVSYEAMHERLNENTRRFFGVG